MVEGVDYSWSRPSPASLAAAGKKFAMRYVPYLEQVYPSYVWTQKGLTDYERRDLVGHGLSVGLVWETTAGRAKEGYYAGRTDASMCAGGLAHCGMPADSVIYFAVDFDANVGQRFWPPYHSGAIREYLKGASSVLGLNRTGVYGGFYVVEWALKNGYVRWGWQTYAWSAGKVSTRAHVLQYDNFANVGGVPVDLNRSLKADFGQWPRPGIPDTATAPPAAKDRIDGDPNPMRYKSLIENGKLTVHREIKAGKPIRKGALTTSGVWETTAHRRNIAPWGYIEASDLPYAEAKFGRVYLINVFTGSGSAVGYVKGIDLV